MIPDAEYLRILRSFSQAEIALMKQLHPKFKFPRFDRVKAEVKKPRNESEVA